MALDRKPRFKSRAALEGSTALPAATAAVLDDVGQHAADLAAEAVASPPAGTLRRGGRKAQARMAGPVVLAEASAARAAADPLPHPAISPPATIHDEPVVDPAIVTTPVSSEPEPPVEVEPKASVSDEVLRPVAAAVPEAPRPVDLAPVMTADPPETLAGATRSTVVQIRAETEVTTPTIVIETVDGTEALSAFNAKMADAIRVTVAESMSFVTALMAVRSLPEAVSINTEHLNRRMETLVTQGRELTLLAQKVAMVAWRGTSIG